MVITLYIYSVHERMKELMKKTIIYQFEEFFEKRSRYGGFWRKGGETPSVVKKEDRIIRIHEGSWSYLVGTIGRVPKKVIGTTTPKEPPDHQKSAWCFSIGDELIIHWELSSSIAAALAPANAVSLHLGPTSAPMHGHLWHAIPTATCHPPISSSFAFKI